MNSEIIPFGKYKGQSVETLMNDRPYLEWLQNQDWFKSRYQNINTLIINNFREPAETPEHNKLQALFLDDNFLHQFITYLQANLSNHPFFIFSKWNDNTGQWDDIKYTEKDWTDLALTKITFEENGIDVALGRFNIEIKPVLSHDYPAVLRQMKAQKSDILFIDSFQADGITIDQVRKIFYPIIIISNRDL